MQLPSSLTSMTSRLLRTRRGGSSRRVASGTALTLVAGLLVVMAVNADGSPISKVDLNDGSVWITKDSDGIVGRLNSQVKELDLGVVTSAAETDLHQEAADVQVVDFGGGGSRRVMVVDVAGGALGKKLELPKTVDISAGRRTVAMVDTQSGQGWVKSDHAIDGFTVKEPPNVSGLGQKSTVTVGSDGTAYFLNRVEGSVVPVALDANGLAVVRASIGLDGELGDDVAMTIVGDRPVVLDRGSATIYRPGGHPIKVDDGAKAELQLSQGVVGGQPDVFYVSTPTGLYRSGLGGGDLTQVSKADVNGAPAAPGVVAGCIYAAWLDTGAKKNFERVCGDEHESKKIPQLSDNANLVFRINRDVVVLNDASGGNAWMVQAGMEIVRNWDLVDPRKEQEQEQVKKQKEKDPNKNDPPKAKDDKNFGARPGSTVVLPVTVNDADPDGDILTISPNIQGGNADVQLSVVGNGTQIQARIGSNVRDEVRFTYAVTDGQPDHAESPAEVTLKIESASKDSKPEKFEERTNELIVARGHEAQLNVMPAWFDPEGDSLVLTQASSKGGDVRFRPDGTITFVDDGKGTGKTIDFTLQGGEATVKAKVDVSVVSPDKAPPETVADRFAGVAGSAILVDPLTNDSDPLGGPLELTRLEPQTASRGRVEVSFDRLKGTGTVRAAEAGSYYLEYVAANVAASAKPQVVRVDVIARGRTNHPPIAEKDTATLVSGKSALVDVLANDSDPDGDVLVVRGFGEIPDGIKASLVDKQFVRVESVAPLDGQKEITYHLSDGDNQVDGSITVGQSEGERNRPPVAQNDQFAARAGTIITVPVLANDSDPEGDKLTVYGQDLTDLPADVPVIATGSSLRIRVPDDGRTELEFGYTTRDPDLAGASARVVLNISPDSPKGNEAPRPAPIDDRTVSGQKIRIPISAYNSDPDGDPVSFRAVVQQPELGRIVGTGVDWIEYEAFDDSAGTDSFRIEVSDQYDARARVDIRVGVAPREPINQAPTALSDELFVKPGRTIQYPVRDNDTDPDGDGFSLLPELSVAPGTEAEVVGNLVKLKSPALDGQSERVATAEYAVTDRLGGQSRATLTVTSSELAPFHAPIANDDTASLAEIAGKKPGDSVRVDVLDNDGDTDGSKADLSFEPLDGGKKVDGQLEVMLTKTNQVVAYRIVDADDQVSFGFVHVSGTDSVPPVLDDKKVPITVTAGELKEIDLAEIVKVRVGHEVRIARRDQISIVNGDGKTEPSTDDQTLTFRSLKSYYGPASMLLEVTDGKNLNDPNGLISQITVPIDVEPAANVAPIVRSTSVAVSAGGEAVEVDLKRLAEDPNGDDLSFKIGEGDKGVSGEVDGDVLKVKADGDAKVGDTVQLALFVDDKKVKKPSVGTVQVRVVDSTKPLMTLVNPIAMDGAAGKPSEIDLLKQIVTDPFPDESKKVSSEKVISGEGTVRRSGVSLVATPARDFDGVLVIGFRMDDGSGLASRTVAGRIEVTVADRPDPPGRPGVDAAGPDAVRLSWTAPDDNGKPIDQYRVSWNGGKKECDSTQCLIENLDPGTEYIFTVAAHNAVDWGKESPKSAPVTPDEVPEQMGAPTIGSETTFPARDKKLDVSWKTPENTGSAITNYEIQQSPGSTKTFAASTLTSPFSSLANGTEYKFRARAVNAKGEGAWSNWSDTATPFTKPGPVGGVVISADPPDGSGNGHVNVSWNAPSEDGGDPDGISSYTVEVVANGSVVASKKSSGSPTDFTVDNGKQYSARIKAETKAGSADQWVESGKVTVYDKAKAPTNLTQTGADGDKKGTLSFTTPSDDGGFPITKYKVLTQDGSSYTTGAPTSAKGASTSLEIAFDGNHNDGQWVRLTPVTEPTGRGPVDGASGRSDAVFRPFGEPGAPGSNGSTQGYRETTVRWNGGTENGRPIERTEYQGHASGNAGASGGSATIGTDQGGEQRCVQARSFAAGKWSAWSGNICGTARPRTVTVTYAGYVGNPPGPCTSNCDALSFSVDGFVSDRPNYHYTTNITASDGSSSPNGYFGTGGDGRGGAQNIAYYDRTRYNEVYCVTVDGVQGCVQGR